MDSKDNENLQIMSAEEIEKFLNENFQFSKNWFIKNAPNEFIRDWFNARRTQQQQPATTPIPGTSESSASTSTTYLLNNFNLENQILESIVTSLDGENEMEIDIENNNDDNTNENDFNDKKSNYLLIHRRNTGRNSITKELFINIVDNKNQEIQNQNESINNTNNFRKLICDGQLSEEQLLMELISDITNELNVDRLCYKILVNVCLLIKCDRCSLFLAKGNRKNRYLVAKLFDVTSDCLFEDTLINGTAGAGGSSTTNATKNLNSNYLANNSNSNNIPPIPFGTGIIGHVALTKQSVNIKNVYEDSRFNREIDQKTGYQTKSMICQPILNFLGDVIGVAQCINKLPLDNCFTEKDEQIFQHYLKFCGFSIQNAQLFEMSLMEYKRYQLLLDLARTIFIDTTNLDLMIKKIMSKTRTLLECDKCRVYITVKNFQKINSTKKNSSNNYLNNANNSKNNNFDLVFQSIFELNNDNGEVLSIQFDKNIEEMDILISYAEQSAKSKKTLNSENYLDPERPHSISILSVPIFNNENRVLGVAQIIKNGNKGIFSEVEISVIEAFSIFCGLGLQSCLMYEEMVKLNAHQQIALEILAYHASAKEEETIEIMNNPIPMAEHFQLNSIEFDDQKYSDNETILACLRIFIDLNFLKLFPIRFKVLCRFLLSIKKNYRNVIYHNWRHALNVTQTMYFMLKKCQLETIFNFKEQLALIVASICHDLDHRGFNNSFQSKISHPFTKIYSTSYLENHHFHHTMLILKTEGNNIFAEFPSSDLDEIFQMIEECILSTDLAQYMSKKGKFQELVHMQQMDLNNAEIRILLRAMLMTACDLSAICKPWPIQQRTAELVANEFYLQGDLEKSFNIDPLPMMDRQHKDELPQMQVGFIDHVCLPLYEVLYEFWPQLEPFYSGCKSNRQHWENLKEKRRVGEGN